MSKTWQEFVDSTKDMPPKPLLVNALAYLGERKDAVDLGAGSLTDSKYLVAQGFAHVTAVDKEAYVEDATAMFPEGTFRYLVSSFEELSLPEQSADLINAQYSLPFTRKEAFPELFGILTRALREGGVFVGQLFGPKDDWSSTMPHATFFTRSEVEGYLEGYEVLVLDEREADGTLVNGQKKHWHLYDIIARKRS